MKKNAVGWFEIPVKDMSRAVKFYESILNIKLELHQMGPLEMAIFPSHESYIGSSGALVYNAEYYKPSVDGVLIYLSSATNDIRDEIGRIETSGGKVIIPRKLIAEDIGYMAVFIDTEGNRIALHSRN